MSAAEQTECAPLEPERCFSGVVAPGACAVVAVHDGRIADFVQTRDDGVPPAYVLLVAVGGRFGKPGVGRRSVEGHCGGGRVGLGSTEKSVSLHGSARHRPRPGCRVSPGGGG